MTVLSPPPAVRPPTGGAIGQSLRDSFIVAKSGLIRVKRAPGMIIFMLIQPTIFIVLFTFVFAGSVSIGGSTDRAAFREFNVVGIMAQTVVFSVIATAAGIADDMRKGLVDRFRSLPMARGAVLTGRTLSDAVTIALVLVVLGSVGAAVGWRFHEGIPKMLAGFALLFLLGYAFTWVGALTGLISRSPETASSAPMLWIFPVSFISNAFVDPTQMSTPLRYMAEWNPFSATVQAARILFGNPGTGARDAWPMQHPIEASLIYSVIIIVVFRTLAVRKYRRTATS
ncbi:ABC transporter permease [Streptomyces sp. NBC_01255]|uniref:ABC transporter permease n=1 Tax=Streptomyces sp. NBC_01255 TaxID=2903798 RepID=UPI002E32D59C|nr:ABC transporter permease [Streptomyces sp. NBC_01255]